MLVTNEGGKVVAVSDELAPDILAQPGFRLASDEEQAAWNAAHMPAPEPAQTDADKSAPAKG